MFRKALEPILVIPVERVIFFNFLHWSKADAPMVVIFLPRDRLASWYLFRKALSETAVTLSVIPRYWTGAGMFADLILVAVGPVQVTVYLPFTL